MPLSAQQVHQRLSESARKFRWSRSVPYVLGGGALALICLMAFLGLDQWLHLGTTGRWIAFVIVVSTGLGGAFLAWRAWRPTISAASMARRIEQTSGGGNVLISAVQFSSSSAKLNPALRTALFQEMSDPFPSVQWDKVFNVEIIKKIGYVLGSVAVILMAWAILKPGAFTNSAARIFMPASNIPPITRTKIVALTPGNSTVVHGGQVTVSVRLDGEIPRVSWLYYREMGSSWQKVLMAHEAGQHDFDFTWKEMRQPVQYYVQAGDISSDKSAITVRPKTAIKSRTAELQPPAYTHLPKKTLADFSVLQDVVPGSQLSVGLEFNNDVAEVMLDDDKGSPLKISKKDGTHWSLAGQVLSSRTLKLQFRDTVGATDRAVMTVATKADEPPKLAIMQPVEGRELIAARGAQMTLQFTVSDNFGLGSVAVYQSSADKDDAKLLEEFKAAVGQKTFTGKAQITVLPAGDEERVTFRIIAHDENDVTGPGVTTSRPIVVSLHSADKLAKKTDDDAAKFAKGLEALIKVQQTNYDETRAAAFAKAAGPLTPLVERQSMIESTARLLVSAASSNVRRELESLLQREMPAAIIALRNGDSAVGASREPFLFGATKIEAMILARLKGTPATAEDEKKKAEVTELIAGLDDLLKRQRDLMRETKAGGELPPLASKQDALAERGASVKKQITADSTNANIGTPDFRARLSKVATLFTEYKIHEEMLGAAEHLENSKAGSATELQGHVVANLAKLVSLLNQWQVAEAEEKAKDLRAEAEAMKVKLEKLVQIQKEIVEKTKDLARKDEFDANDVATAKEFSAQKDLMKDVIEQMTTDLQAFPEMKPAHEMKDQLMSVFEDVIQADKEESRKGKIKPEEIAVQKEQGLLDALEKAKELPADMEMWLPNKQEAQKWLLENFDKSEMPDIPNVPLADAMEDLVGDLLETQKDLENDIKDAASNQALANPVIGWEVRDGPMPGFGAQGKSGNEKPNHNEQMGRSGGGREGMSNGEMAGTKSLNLKGDEPDARRTNDKMQAGMVEDEGGINKTRATGGGKAGAFSDRQGMEGDAPIKATNAPPGEKASALAVAQAILKEKTAKKVAQANLLYLKTEPLREVVQLMDQSSQAMAQGRMRDAQGFHERIVGRLTEIKSGLTSGQVVSIGTSDAARTQDKQLLGGSEGEAPAQYKEMVSDYFRSLVEAK
jgi:hypothetical protein